MVSDGGWILSESGMRDVAALSVCKTLTPVNFEFYALRSVLLLNHFDSVPLSAVSSKNAVNYNLWSSQKTKVLDTFTVQVLKLPLTNFLPQLYMSNSICSDYYNLNTFTCISIVKRTK